MLSRFRSKRTLIIGGSVLVVGCLFAAGGWYVLAHSAPGRFSLVSTRPSPKPTPTANSAEFAARQFFCDEFAPPSESKRCMAGTIAYRSTCPAIKATSQPFPAGVWLIGSGSEAGFRVHERIIDLELPHEAVARTDHVAGGMVVSNDGAGLQIQQACVAVSTLSLHSVDTLPGIRTTSRDGTIPDVAHGLYHPVATFRAENQPLPAPAADGQKQTVRMTGEFTISGLTKPVDMTVEGSLQGQQLQVVGSFPITLADYGMSPPENPVAAVDSKVIIEFHLFLDRQQPRQ